MRFVLSFPLFCVLLAAQPSISRVAFSESRDVVRGFSPSGEIMLSIHQSRLDVAHSGGKHDLAHLTVVYDAPTGHYFWLCRQANGPGDSISMLNGLKDGSIAVYAGPDAIVVFNFSGDLWYQEHRASADSLGAAERASFTEMEQDLARLTDNGFDAGFREVEIARAIGPEFACPGPGDRDFTGRCSREANKIASIGREGDNWRLVLRNRWDQEVILDSKFNLVSTRRLPAPPKE